MNWTETPVIFLAALVAGGINSVAGGGTLLSFPALLWVGRDPIVANATNTMALWPGALAGFIGYRRELKGSGRWLWLFSLPSFAGGTLGAVLLLRTPTERFAAIVPYLILFATLVFAGQNTIQRLLRLRLAGSGSHSQGSGSGWTAGTLVFQFLVAVYGGYFGAGMGILMLAALSLMGMNDIHRMNGMKNWLALSINGIAAVYFAASGAVHWGDAAVMSVGAVAGGYGSAGLARRLGRAFVQRVVVAIGLGMTVSLLLRG